MNQVATGDDRQEKPSDGVWKVLGYALRAGSHVMACAWAEGQTAAGARQGHDYSGMTDHTALNICMHARHLSGWRASGERGQKEA